MEKARTHQYQQCKHHDQPADIYNYLKSFCNLNSSLTLQTELCHNCVTHICWDHHEKQCYVIHCGPVSCINHGEVPVFPEEFTLPCLLVDIEQCVARTAATLQCLITIPTTTAVEHSCRLRVVPTVTILTGKLTVWTAVSTERAE